MNKERDLITTAVKNWQPRFLVAGVNFSDLRDNILPRADSWIKWAEAWSDTGDMHYQLGVQALQEGNKVTAGQAYARAAVYYQFSQFTLTQYPEKKKELTLKKVKAYNKAAPLLKPLARRVEIPFEETYIPGYLRVPENTNNLNIVILIPGADSTKEEFRTLEEGFLKRGMATISIDGPGQGEMRYNMLLRPDYEKAVSAVIDFLETYPDIKYSKIGLCGISMGGTFVIRSAAYDDRVSAVVDVAGFYHINYWDKLGTLLKHTLTFLFDADSEEEAKKASYRIDLSGIIKEVKCPLLVVHGELDGIVPVEDARKMYAEAECNKKLIIYREGNHVCNNISYKYRPLVADWLNAKLS